MQWILNSKNKMYGSKCYTAFGNSPISPPLLLGFKMLHCSTEYILSRPGKPIYYILDSSVRNGVKCEGNQAPGKIYSVSFTPLSQVRNGYRVSPSEISLLVLIIAHLSTSPLLCISFREHSYHCASGPADSLDCDGGCRCLYLQTEAKVRNEWRNTTNNTNFSTAVDNNRVQYYTALDLTCFYWWEDRLNYLTVNLTFAQSPFICESSFLYFISSVIYSSISSHKMWFVTEWCA